MFSFKRKILDIFALLKEDYYTHCCLAFICTVVDVIEYEPKLKFKYSIQRNL